MNMDRAAAGAINGTRRKEVLVLCLCIFIGFALRFHTFDQKSLWIDEVHTYNDSREGVKGQIKYFKEHPADLLHPPLFYVLTHIFYPFDKPERDLRIIPLVFGILSVPMIYFLAKAFSHRIALPCTLALTFMAYHISFSQDGRPYSLIMFLGMAGLYFLLRYLGTDQKRNLLIGAFFFSILFYTSYSSIPFILLSQILWFYPFDDNERKPRLGSVLKLNGIILFFCAPWIIFLILNYKGQRILNQVFIEDFGSLWNILVGLFNDWVPFIPLTVISVMLLILFPLLSPKRMKAVILLSVVFLPVFGLYLCSRLFHIQHFFSSKYVINFLPLFLISIFLSLGTLEMRFEKWNRILRFKVLFLILFITSNIILLPLYYRSERQDFRGLVSYLEGRLRQGDEVFVKSAAYIPGMLHYFGVHPESRHHNFPVWAENSGKEIVARVTIVGKDKRFGIHYSSAGYDRYLADDGRLWIIAGKQAGEEMKKESPFVFQGVFDGSFSQFRRFPEDASMYLFLWDPESPGGKGTDVLPE
jgi:mannosyltransferase